MRDEITKLIDSSLPVWPRQHNLLSLAKRLNEQGRYAKAFQVIERAKLDGLPDNAEWLDRKDLAPFRVAMLRDESGYYVLCQTCGEQDKKAIHAWHETQWVKPPTTKVRIILMAKWCPLCAPLFSTPQKIVASLLHTKGNYPQLVQLDKLIDAICKANRFAVADVRKVPAGPRFLVVNRKDLPAMHKLRIA